MALLLTLLFFLPIGLALWLTGLGLWLLLAGKASPWIGLSLTLAPTFAALWTFGGYRGLSLPLLTGDLTGMPPNLHLAGIVLAFVLVQAALVALVRNGPTPVIAIVCMALCCAALAGPLLVHGKQREAMQRAAAVHSGRAVTP